RCSSTHGAGGCRRRTSSRCCPLWTRRWAGWAVSTNSCRTATRLGVASPTRAGRTPPTPCSSPTVRSPSLLSPCVKSRVTPMRPRFRAPRCSTRSGVRARGDGGKWAAGLAQRFRERYWINDYPAIALDGSGRRVDTVTSNIGHLLGTGMLDDAEEARVAARLATSDMDCGFGLRTLASTSTGYNPLSYHCGSVWPHDTPT